MNGLYWLWVRQSVSVVILVWLRYWVHMLNFAWFSEQEQVPLTALHWQMARRGAMGASDLHLWELEEREADRLGLMSYRCPCRNCMGGRCISRATIRKHLRTIGRDPQFTVPILVCLHATTRKAVEIWLEHVNMTCPIWLDLIRICD